MKIRLTLEVPDMARLYVARHLAPPVKKNAKGYATREEVARFLQREVLSWASEQGSARDRPLTELESREAGAAIDWLRKAGRTDAQIRAWLLAQRAALHFPVHDLVGAPAGPPPPG